MITLELRPASFICGCGGYGGNWSFKLREHHVGWELHPDTQDDHIGYAWCVCTIRKSRDELDAIDLEAELDD